MSHKTNLLLLISVIVVQLHNTGVAGTPCGNTPCGRSAASDPRIMAWYNRQRNHPVYLTTGHLTPAMLTPDRNSLTFQMNRLRNIMMNKNRKFNRNRPSADHHLTPGDW